MISRLLNRLRRLLRPVCWWRGKHRGPWIEGFSVCRTCGERRRSPAPPGTVLTDERQSKLYQMQRDGSVRRITPKQTKAERRKSREANA